MAITTLSPPSIWEPTLFGDAETPSLFQQVDSICEEMRFAMSLTSSWEASKRELTAAGEKLVGIIPDHTAPEGLSTSIASFLRSSLLMHVEHHQIAPFGKGPVTGADKSSLFKVRGRKDPVVVKAIPENSLEFVREVSALLDFTALKMHSLTPPKLLSLGKCCVQGKEYYLIAESYLEGTNLKFQLLSFLKYTSPREQPFNYMMDIFHALGRGLGELHTTRCEQAPFMHPSLACFYDTIISTALRKLTAHREHNIPLGKLEKTCRGLLSELKSKPCIRSFVHEDAHFKNFLYHYNTQTISIVDMESASSSIGSFLTPLGMAASDYVRVLENLRESKKHGLTVHEHTQLEEEFIKGYTSQGAPIPTAPQQEFFEILIMLGLINYFIDRTEFATDAIAKNVQEYMAYAVRRLNAKL